MPWYQWKSTILVCVNKKDGNQSEGEDSPAVLGSDQPHQQYFSFSSILGRMLISWEGKLGKSIGTCGYMTHKDQLKILGKFSFNNWSRNGGPYYLSISVGLSWKTELNLASNSRTRIREYKLWEVGYREDLNVIKVRITQPLEFSKKEKGYFVR